MENIVTNDRIEGYCAALTAAEYAKGTIAKYRRDLLALADWLDNRPATQENLTEWKSDLMAKNYAPCTINSMLAAANGFFRQMGRGIKLKFLRVQRQLYRDGARELSRAEYERLLAAARESGKVRLALIMETLCAAGIRISELRYITIEVAKARRTTIALKGKIWTILLSKKLCDKLLRYTRKNGITTGEIFRTKSGCGISGRQVWQEMKQLCEKAGVTASKVFPHNFRRLFAVTYYKASKDIARLADVLGHSSIETTRIYLMISEKEQARQLERLGLVSYGEINILLFP